MMVGDQLDRDIEPAKAAGFVTAWFPGGFTPRWSSNRSDAADLQITNFDEAAKAFLILTRNLQAAAGARHNAPVPSRRATPAKRRIDTARSSS
jgi:hypothetical protein